MDARAAWRGLAWALAPGPGTRAGVAGGVAVAAAVLVATVRDGPVPGLREGSAYAAAATLPLGSWTLLLAVPHRTAALAGTVGLLTGAAVGTRSAAQRDRALGLLAGVSAVLLAGVPLAVAAAVGAVGVLVDPGRGLFVLGSAGAVAPLLLGYVPALVWLPAWAGFALGGRAARRAG